MPTTTTHVDAANKLRRLVKRYNTAEHYRYLAHRDDDFELEETRSAEMKRIANSTRNLIDKCEIDADPQLVFATMLSTSRVKFLDGSVA